MSSRQNWEDFPYFLAMRLSERIDYVRYNKIDISKYMNRRLAQYRLKQWRKQYPFTNKKILGKLLAQHGITFEEFAAFLGARNIALPAQPDIHWVSLLKTIFTEYNSSDEIIRFPEDIVRNWPMLKLLETFQPFLQFASRRFRQALQQLLDEYPGKMDEASILQQFLINIPAQPVWLISKTLVLELNIARVQNKLSGKTSAERFDDFLQHMQKPENLFVFLSEYPVLARLLAVTMIQWVDTFVELLTHLCQDWEQIQACFSPDADLGLLGTIGFGKGDRHRNGRTVAIVTFSIGVQVVYKPREMLIDSEFQKLLGWVNRQGLSCPFKEIKILDCGKHGWADFVFTYPCRSTDEIGRYYQRLGAYLALLYALEANDFHYENLIIQGEYPILVDLETLFTPYEGENSEALAYNFYLDSVFVPGLLPQRIWGKKDDAGVDISGIGMRPGQMSPDPVPVWDQENTDEMHIFRKHLPLEDSVAQLFEGGEVDPLQYLNEITIGFTELYNLLIQQRTELLSSDGPLISFAKVKTRFLARPTKPYAILLREGAHPDLLQDAMDLEHFYNHLWPLAIRFESLQALIPSEQTDLWQLDIPFFVAEPASKDLWDSQGAIIPSHFQVSGQERVFEKIKKFGPDNLRQQLWVIRASLKTIQRVKVDSSPNQQLVKVGEMTIEIQPTPENVISASQKAADYLYGMALTQNQFVGWFGLQPIGQDYLNVEPVGNDLYNGLAGITLYLAYFGWYTKQEKYTLLARRTLASVWRSFQKSKTLTFENLGAFEGAGSMIYLLTHLGVLWNEKKLHQKALRIVHRVPRTIAKDKVFDIIAGSSGCIAALLAFHAVTGNQVALDVARMCGEHLLANATKTEHGVAWQGQVFQSPLCGFSHGVAGVAWSLFRLAHAIGDPKFAHFAAEALKYERGAFLAELGNWPDLRNFSTERETGEAVMWCHGAPGIGLARLATLPYYDTLEIRAEIDVAISTTLAKGFNGSHCLCHGDLGNLELLLQANNILGNHWHVEVDKIVHNVLCDIERAGWRCGAGVDVQVPGLMTGVAGIGYQLLRLAAPEHIPSILLLEPPRNPC